MRVCIICRAEPPLDDTVAVLYRGRLIDWCICLTCDQREHGIPPAAFGRSAWPTAGQRDDQTLDMPRQPDPGRRR